MTRVYDLISKIRDGDFREGVDYSILINNQEKSYTIHSRQLQKSLRKELSDFPQLVENEWNTPIIKMEQHRGERFVYQGDGGNSFDKLTILGNSSSFGLLEGRNSPARIREITDIEARQFERRGVETIRNSFLPFSQTSDSSNYHGDRNREIKQRELEKRQRELKEQEEKLAIEQKKLEEEMKAETQRSQSQNFQPNRDGQGGGSIPPASSFWAFVIHILALAGVLL